MMENILWNTDKAVQLLAPESDLEKQFLQNNAFCEGLFWGTPRFGHPEGKVLFHIREVLDNIDKLQIDSFTRQKLRIIAFVHDTFKYKEHRGVPRDWTRHHAVLARHFLEKYTDNKLLLDLTEYHDEAYYVWRYQRNPLRKPEAKKRLEGIYQNFNGSIQLYYLFFKCDTCTGDKNQASLHWFEENIKGIKPVSL